MNGPKSGSDVNVYTEDTEDLQQRCGTNLDDCGGCGTDRLVYKPHPSNLTQTRR